MPHPACAPGGPLRGLRPCELGSRGSRADREEAGRGLRRIEERIEQDAVKIDAALQHRVRGYGWPTKLILVRLKASEGSRGETLDA